ncbi:MAG: septum formation initiator family protein [Xanthomonadales bacterium]|nr:septum formation initiator family protein [Xanthomonadales bacterium]
MLILLLLVLLLLLQIRLWVAPGGMREVERLRQAIAAQERDNAARRERNERLLAEVEDLRAAGPALEERAREELGLVAPDEVFFQVIEEPPPERAP